MSKNIISKNLPSHNSFCFDCSKKRKNMMLIQKIRQKPKRKICHVLLYNVMIKSTKMCHFLII